MSLEKLRVHCNSSKTKKTKIDTKDVNGSDGNSSNGIINMVVAGKNKVVAGFTNLLSGEKPDETTSFEEYLGHKLDDRVWVYINENPHCGIIKYIGRVPREGEEIFAGIHLVGYIMRLLINIVNRRFSYCGIMHIKLLSSFKVNVCTM